VPDRSEKKRLIVNADDLGLHRGVNRGIICAHTEGILTSASLLGIGEAFEEAARLAREHPSLDLGVHLALVGARPVSPPEDVPSLVDRQGQFPRDHIGFLRYVAQGRIRWVEVERELQRQVEKVLEAGLPVTHLDSHQHLHVLPPLLEIVLGLAQEFGGLAVRFPLEERFPSDGPHILKAPKRWLQWKALLSAARRARPRFVRMGIPFPDHFFGMWASGRLDEALLISLLRHLPEGSSEIICHPGEESDDLRARFPWGYHWERELKALLSPGVRAVLDEEGIERIGFGEMVVG